jgi:hypothetical protein
MMASAAVKSVIICVGLESNSVLVRITGAPDFPPMKSMIVLGGALISQSVYLSSLPAHTAIGVFT